MVPFKHVTIVGLGLIGGSLGMALRRKHLARTVVGVSRTARTLRLATRRGAIDVGMTDPVRAARGADLVILATPVDVIVPLALRLARVMRDGAVLSDVGSTKGEIVRTLQRRLPAHVAFVGAHPLAGSERRGIDAARPELFQNSLCLLTPTTQTRPAAVRAVTRLWAPLVCRVLLMSPERHDRLVAAMSHLPHAVAIALTSSAPPEGLAVAPRSFLEMTRIAGSDPDLWDDIFLSNRTAVLNAMTAFEREWRALRAALVRADRPALRRRLAAAQARRKSLE